MDKLVAYIIGEAIQIQRAEYIEDGWFIIVHKDTIQLYEIPLGGGEAILVKSFPTLLEAIKFGESLT